MGSKPLAQFFQCYHTIVQITVQTFRLDVDAVKAVLFTQLQILHDGMACAETVICFIKSDSHSNTLLNQYGCMWIAGMLYPFPSARSAWDTNMLLSGKAR